MRSRRLGLSVVEILVAMVLLATGVIFALSAVSYATKATAGTTQSTEATAYARKILELMLGGGPKSACLSGGVNPVYENVFKPLYGTDGVLPPFEEADFTITTDASEAAQFRESARQFEVKFQITPYIDPGPPPAPMEGLYSVDVQLRWRDRLGVRVTSYPGLYRQE